MNGGPQPMTHHVRLALAHEIADRVRARYGDAVMAIGIYGSLARGDDGPYSDIEMLCVLRAISQRQIVEWSAGPWKAEVDLYSEEELLRKAEMVDGRWPLTHGAFRHILPLHDPQVILARVRSATYAAADSAFRAAIEELLVCNLYEFIGKVRNDAASGWTGALAMRAVEIVRDTAYAIALSQRHTYTSSAKLLAEALDLPDQPAGFAPLARLVMAGRLDDAPMVIAACEALWSGLEAWAAAHGLTMVSTERIPI